MLKKFSTQDLPACCELYVKVFNAPPWNDSWTDEAVRQCLGDLAERKRFLGYTFWENDALVGAVFAHTKTFYKGDEIFIDELFIAPNCQRKGYGLALMDEIENYARENNITAITLLTAIGQPAFHFYKKQGYWHKNYMAFMHKRVT
jgi:GNAT superfamily N-acetyltransferase